MEMADIGYDQISETDNGFWIDVGEGRDVFIPRKVVIENDEQVNVITVEGWFAEKEGLV